MIDARPLTIADHVHGYPDIAFGGYVAGLLAAHSTTDLAARSTTDLPGHATIARADHSSTDHDPAAGIPAMRVDFRRAVSVGAPLLLQTTGDGRAVLADAGGMLLVEAAASSLAVTPRPAPSWDDAKTATEAALTSPKRVVTDCYGCGVLCEPGRGLRLFPWSTPDGTLMAAAWTPDAALADENGEVTTANVWSALDCPGGIAAWVFSKMGQGAFTAALTATQVRPVLAGADYISHAWSIGQDGRKHTVGVALSTADGELCALAEALWIEPRTA
ncbi:hypothetical protein JK358_06375 [Nocardia sp. 2]|uniref:Thioesterase family protein n=1 Tax=Nocardia acididurans TaxID=2802282 RepID=A0ABS1M103_9NOCA|nr:hypothetical protein [Nocardia acididurans]MBL1074016.1 hypothetical protein [Nocardia acididurans]